MIKKTTVSSRVLADGSIISIGYEYTTMVVATATVNGETADARPLRTPKGEYTHYATIGGKSYGITDAEQRAAIAECNAVPEVAAIREESDRYWAGIARTQEAQYQHDLAGRQMMSRGGEEHR